MQRMLIVYNPRSSQAAEVREKVLSPAQKLAGYMIGKYEVANTNLEDNMTKLARLIEDGDVILAAGGDATAIIAVNAVMRSGKKAELAVLPYGNFNDLARTLQLKNLDEVVKARAKKFYPLAVYVNGKFWRYATCYVTIGMTAEAVTLYDKPAMREKLKSKYGREVSSYTELIGWYFRNRRKKQFIPAFALNGRAEDPRVSDYAAVNGRYMARVMRGREDFGKAKEFRSVTDRLTSFWRLFKLMSKSILDRVPGEPTTGDKLEFLTPATVALQAEGESEVFEKVRTIEIKKDGKWFKARQK